MGARQRLVCEMSPGADNHRGRIPTFTVALDLRCLHGDERGPRLGAVRAIGEQTNKRAMFICKASLFLNRLTTLYDGVSFIVEGRR